MTEQALRDAWARWTEARPDDLDWKLRMEMVAGVPELPLAAAPVAVVAGFHELLVELLGPPRAFYPVALRDGWREREVIASWRVATGQAVAIVDVLTGLWPMARGLRGPTLELLVWERLRG